MTTLNDPNVNHPAHYASGKIEVIEAIEDWGHGKGFCRGNAIKYLARAGKKDPEKEIEDLKKARWYLSREIETLEAAEQCREVTRPNDMNPKTIAETPTSAIDALNSDPTEETTDTAPIVQEKNFAQYDQLDGHWQQTASVSGIRFVFVPNQQAMIKALISQSRPPFVYVLAEPGA